jgi:hypothetical protein
MTLQRSSFLLWLSFIVLIMSRKCFKFVSLQDWHHASNAAAASRIIPVVIHDPTADGERCTLHSMSARPDGPVTGGRPAQSH